MLRQVNYRAAPEVVYLLQSDKETYSGGIATHTDTSEEQDLLHSGMPMKAQRVLESTSPLERKGEKRKQTRN